MFVSFKRADDLAIAMSALLQSGEEGQLHPLVLRRSDICYF